MLKFATNFPYDQASTFINNVVIINPLTVMQTHAAWIFWLFAHYKFTYTR